MTTYDARSFYDGLVEHGHLVPVGPKGAFGRGPVFEDVLRRFDGLTLDAAGDDVVESVTFPPVIDRSIIEESAYMDSFPNLCGAVHSFMGSERDAPAIGARIHAGEEWGDLLSMSDLVLSPAGCYPFYPTCRGTLPDDGRYVTLLAWVFRQEPSDDPTRMRSFRVREFIRVGTPETVVAWRNVWRTRCLDLLASLGLPAHDEVAADPFFGRAGRMLAAGQIDQELKFEVRIPVVSEEHPTACSSVNYHQDKFGQAFGIRTPDGEVAHSSCLGFGMERVTMALFRTHGFDPARWPARVRERFWP